MSKKIPLVQAIAWIVCTTLFVTGGVHAFFNGHLKMQRKKRSDPSYFLSRIVQTGPQKQALSTDYLAELLHVSANKPIHYGEFNVELAERRLRASPVIQEVKVDLIEPSTIYVDYTVRQPIAWLYDFENTAIDENGYPFPVTPFLTPKNLPEIYLNIDQITWNKPIQGKAIELSLTILKLLSEARIPPRRLDLSHAFADSLGRREIVLITEEGGYSRILRLSLKNYAQELGNYQTLRSRLPPVAQVIDLRIPQLAFIENKNPSN